MGLGNIYRVVFLLGAAMCFRGRKHLEGCTAEVTELEPQIYPRKPLKAAGVTSSGSRGVFSGGQAWAWLRAPALRGHHSLPHVSTTAGPDRNVGM